MDGPDARALLDDTERLRRRPRADRHLSSVPLPGASSSAGGTAASRSAAAWGGAAPRS
jgi:hypothetical protein